MKMFAREFPGNGGQCVTMRPEAVWTISGSDWSELTVAPSIDASASGHWHGLIKSGDLK